MHLGWPSRRWVAFGLIGLGPLVASLASCGSHHGGSGFGTAGSGSSGASVGSSGDDGGSQLCLNPPCGGMSSGGLGLNGSRAGTGLRRACLRIWTAGVIVDDCTSSSVGAPTVASLRGREGPVDSHYAVALPVRPDRVPTGGILPPTLQWSAQAAGDPGCRLPAHEVAALRLQRLLRQDQPDAPHYSAEGLEPSARAEQAGGTDTLTVEITTKAGSSVSGPITEHLEDRARKPEGAHLLQHVYVADRRRSSSRCRRRGNGAV